MTEQNRQTNARLDRIEHSQGQGFAKVNRRIDALTRWLVGIQLASLIAIGSLLLSILNKLPG